MKLPLQNLLPAPQARPVLPLPGGLGLGLARGRVHEVCGPARWTLAAMLMAQGQGAVLWIGPGWQGERPYAPGLAAFADPGRVVFATCARPDDLLWAAEEALRSGVVPLVLTEMPDPPALTPVRRLHLAAEAGAEAARNSGLQAPVGVLMTPGTGGAQGVESRWHLTATPSQSTLLNHSIVWRLDRLRARMEPPASWTLTETGAGEIAGARTTAPMPD